MTLIILDQDIKFWYEQIWKLIIDTRSLEIDRRKAMVKDGPFSLGPSNLWTLVIYSLSHEMFLFIRFIYNGLGLFIIAVYWAWRLVT